VAGTPVAQGDAQGVCGHDSDSLYLHGRCAVSAEPALTV
jgi:hypothetical protein